MPPAQKTDPEPNFDIKLLNTAGVSPQAAKSWLGAAPKLRNSFASDSAACQKFWQAGAKLRAQLPARAACSEDQARAVQVIHTRERDLRDQFLATHAEALYDKLTNNRKNFVRVEQLVLDGAKLVPGLLPSEKALAAEAMLALKDKERIEIDHGLFLAHVLANGRTGRHLCHTMLLPRAESLELLPRLVKEESIDLDRAMVTRQGKASVVEMRNPRFLNAMDDSTLDPIETAIDLALLDPATEIGVLRGGVVDHPKYAGRRLFSSGINLTHLYQGKISFLFYFKHAMGYEHKMFRGMARRDSSIEDTAAATIEKAWIAALDVFAIGGGCQHLLVMDYVLAAKDAYMTLPARKEGIIPGVSNLRLPRFVGDRIARQAIMYGRRLDCDSPEGRLICDEVVPPDDMDQALAGVIDGLTSSGVVSAVSNRRGFRIGQEPLDLFRRYLALYAREQAFCHFSPALIANLERHWNAMQRKA
jgi:(3,5-dihydroxyphenyl)acetyl-CoA 1,2-dioxygenase